MSSHNYTIMWWRFESGRHSAGWNRSAKKLDAYHIATTPTGKRAAK